MLTPPAEGQFESRATQRLPNESLGVVAGDFNRDGKLDIAVIGGYLSILLGNGDGTFKAPVNYPAVGDWIATADFNNDGVLDLVTANEDNSISVFLGNGDGTFQSARISHTTDNCTFVAVGDFNGDHKIDVATIDGPFVSVLLGNGDGTFQKPFDNDSFMGAHQLAVGDFNNDHRLDLAVVGYFGGATDFGIFLGNGDGSLRDSLTYPLTYISGPVAAGDFNKDGKLDLAIGGTQGGSVSVFLGRGNGTFDAETDYFIPGGGSVFARDFNNDGNVDIVSGLTLLLGNGDGTFRPPAAEPREASTAPSGGLQATGDFNRDGLPDIVYLENLATDTVTTTLNTGSVTLSPATPLRFPAQLVDSTSGPLTVELSNTGSSDLSISSIRALGPFHTTNTCGAQLASGADCTVSATFTPSKEGPQNGGLSIVDSASSKPQFIELSGVGTIVKVSPFVLKFGTQKVGTQSPPQVLTVVNEGQTSLVFFDPVVGGTDDGDFFYSTNCVSDPIQPGGTCKVSVTFHPRKTGLRSGTIEMEPQGTAKPRPISLSGTGG